MSCDCGLSRSTPMESPTSCQNKLVGAGFMGLGCYVYDPVLRTFGTRMPSKMSATGCIDNKLNVDTMVAGTKRRIKIDLPQPCPTQVALYTTIRRE